MLSFGFILLTASCSLFQRNEDRKPTVNVAFEKAKYHVAIHEYAKAEPYLLHTISREDHNYTEALLLLGKVYDQLAQPEKSILNLKDYITRTQDPLSLLKAKGLLLKNNAKVKLDIETAPEKYFISSVVTSREPSSQIILEAIRWTMDFNCDLYCVAEVQYLKEIQLQIFYIIEADISLYDRGFDIIKSRYDFFESFLDEGALSLDFRKEIAQNLFSALQKLKSTHLENGTQGSLKTAKIVVYLSEYQKRIERWIYDHS